jgi:uncharacterized protein YjeT (DUF2065 family)
MERSIELYACLQFLIIGLSHMLQPRVWVAFFVALRERGLVGVFINGFISLIFGSLVVAFHNVWTGLPMALTIIGWAQVLKAITSFVAPQAGMRSLERVAPDRAWEFQAAGAVLLGLGGLMAYVLVRA